MSCVKPLANNFVLWEASRSRMTKMKTAKVITITCNHLQGQYLPITKMDMLAWMMQGSQTVREWAAASVRPTLKMTMHAQNCLAATRLQRSSSILIRQPSPVRRQSSRIRQRTQAAKGSITWVRFGKGSSRSHKDMGMHTLRCPTLWALVCTATHPVPFGLAVVLQSRGIHAATAPTEMSSPPCWPFCGMWSNAMLERRRRTQQAGRCIWKS